MAGPVGGNKQATAEMAWALHFARFQTAEKSGSTTPRSGDWTCPKCGPKVNNFASKDICYKCGCPKPKDTAQYLEMIQKSKGIQFAIRGDALLQTRHEGSKNTKKMRNFRTDFESELWDAFGTSEVDHSIMPGYNLKDVTMSIVQGPSYDIMCVGVIIQDLMDQNTWTVVQNYPPMLDNQLQELAAAILGKSPPNGSLVLVGGPARFWNRPPRWDVYMARARNTLRTAGVQVVPAESADIVYDTQLQLSTDGHHILNTDASKQLFAKAWASWLLAAGADPNFGRALTDEPVEVGAENQVWPELEMQINAPPPARSRSPRGHGGGFKGKGGGKGGGFKGKGGKGGGLPGLPGGFPGGLPALPELPGGFPGGLPGLPGGFPGGLPQMPGGLPPGMSGTWQPAGAGGKGNFPW